MRGSIKQVQVKGQNTGWLSMNNIWGAAWEIEQSPQPPLDFRFVDDSGSEVTYHAEPLSPSMHKTRSFVPQRDGRCLSHAPA